MDYFSRKILRFRLFSKSEFRRRNSDKILLFKKAIIVIVLCTTFDFLSGYFYPDCVANICMLNGDHRSHHYFQYDH